MKQVLSRVTIAFAAISLVVGVMSGVAVATSGSSWAKTYCKASDSLKKVVKDESDNVTKAFTGLSASSDLTQPSAVLRTAIDNTAKGFTTTEKALKKAGAPSGVKDGKKLQRDLLAAMTDASKHMQDAKDHLAKFNPGVRTTATELIGAGNDYDSAVSAWNDARLGTYRSVLKNDPKFAAQIAKACKSGV